MARTRQSVFEEKLCCSYCDVVVMTISSPCTFVVFVVTAVSWDCSLACFSISATCCLCKDGGACVDIVISAPRPSERLKLGHDVSLVHAIAWSEQHFPPTASDPELKHNLNFDAGRRDFHAEDHVPNLRLR